nr:reverse transcriptase domain-containing protein [Tanacetum cinerariifolium]
MKNEIPLFYFWCMSTQSSSNQIELHFPNPEKSLQFHRLEESESDNLFHDHIQGEDENAEDVQTADHLRLMEELLQIPIIGIENAMVVPAVLENEFELKTKLLDFICNNSFFGLENDDPHSHIKRFYQITRTFKINHVPHDVELLTIIENKTKVRTCRNKPQVSISGGTSTQTDAIIALTKQVEVLEYHFATMRETYDQNQEAAIQLIQNQMGQMAEDLQKRPLGVLPSNTVTDPLVELNIITCMDGLTLDGSFIPHSKFPIYQEKELESKTIIEVVEITSSQSTPLVPPLETPPSSTPKPKENLEPNPNQPLISSRLQEEKIQALKNPTGCADHFVYSSESSLRNIFVLYS